VRCSLQIRTLHREETRIYPCRYGSLLSFLCSPCRSRHEYIIQNLTFSLCLLQERRQDVRPYRVPLSSTPSRVNALPEKHVGPSWPTTRLFSLFKTTPDSNRLHREYGLLTLSSLSPALLTSPHPSPPHRIRSLNFEEI
jgi:hypothetical protein